MNGLSSFESTAHKHLHSWMPKKSVTGREILKLGVTDKDLLCTQIKSIFGGSWVPLLFVRSQDKRHCRLQIACDSVCFDLHIVYDIAYDIICKASFDSMLGAQIAGHLLWDSILHSS